MKKRDRFSNEVKSILNTYKKNFITVETAVVECYEAEYALSQK